MVKRKSEGERGRERGKEKEREIRRQRRHRLEHIRLVTEEEKEE